MKHNGDEYELGPLYWVGGVNEDISEAENVFILVNRKLPCTCKNELSIFKEGNIT